MKKTLFIFGFGYSARVLARHLSDEFTIIGTSRDISDDMTAASQAHACDQLIQWPGQDIKAALAKATHLLICAAPNEHGDPVLCGAKELIRKIAPQLEWVGYLSTTGVYGDHQGGWVDEDSPLTPATKRGQLRVQAETAWQEFAAETALPLHIFRLAGIYGPNRGPFTKLRRKTARRIIKENQLFSRIHVDDIAQVLTASIAAPKPMRIYNVCDNLAAPPQDVIGYGAQLLGMAPPPDEPFETAQMTPMARSFYSESKQVSNARITTELNVKLSFPTYREGLEDLLRTEGSAD